VKLVRKKSGLLSKFRRKPTYLGAFVLLPAGFDDQPNARYPLAVEQGHFPERGFPTFSPQPPAPGMSARDSTRAAHGYDLFKQWTGSKFPRMLVISIQHANQYFDDSYALNSPNVGPYGDASMAEVSRRSYITTSSKQARQGYEVRSSRSFERHGESTGEKPPHERKKSRYGASPEEYLRAPPGSSSHSAATHLWIAEAFD